MYACCQPSTLRVDCQQTTLLYRMSRVFKGDQRGYPYILGVLILQINRQLGGGGVTGIYVHQILQCLQRKGMEPKRERDRLRTFIHIVTPEIT